MHLCKVLHLRRALAHRAPPDCCDHDGRDRHTVLRLPLRCLIDLSSPINSVCLFLCLSLLSSYLIFFIDFSLIFYLTIQFSVRHSVYIITKTWLF